ncbi:MAG TPA: tRNA lysidine(34) synthetase TilS [Candidatus Saccharimonadales bacterium]|nr:tRNA lysidine(34) synthetase TilS [Candidatus Saccharimonadales bacterium]
MVYVDLPDGKFILAVSGGVDSMVLLDVLRRKKAEFVVAHVNHGLRPDAWQDEALVRSYTKKHNLSFVVKKISLPPHASEEQARKERYDFLQQCRIKFKADAIITAHHNDDLIETALINYMRGTGWRGLAPFVGGNGIVRPLLNNTKDQLIAYARKHAVQWREDSTNNNETYLRNYVRHTLIPLLDQRSKLWRQTFLQHIRKQQSLRNEIEAALNILHANKTTLTRYNVIMWPQHVATEVVQSMLRKITGSSVVRPLAEAAVLFTKTANPHKIMPISRQWQFRVTTRKLIVEPRVT